MKWLLRYLAPPVVIAVVAVVPLLSAAVLPAPVVAAGPPCLPPGVPATVFTSPVVNIRGAMILTETGEDAVFLVTYQVAPKVTVEIGWANSELIVVDADPDGDTPSLVNEKFINPQLALRAKPDGECRWRPAKRSEQT
jgi:uncharacterized membrane protein